jgi:hypothetical protein
MQPTRAQVVPSSPPLISTNDFPEGRTFPRAYNPALPEPMIATSTLRSFTSTPHAFNALQLCFLRHGPCSQAPWTRRINTYRTLIQWNNHVQKQVILRIAAQVR